MVFKKEHRKQIQNMPLPLQTILERLQHSELRDEFMLKLISDAYSRIKKLEETREEEDWYKKKIWDLEEKEESLFISADFDKIQETLKALKNANGDASVILYHIMELEAILGSLERKAAVIELKYESRLAASLRDICSVHEPIAFSKEKIERFSAAVQVLIEGWGKLNREKVKWTRSRLLEVGLTWLPVTDKAAKDISKAKEIIQ